MTKKVNFKSDNNLQQHLHIAKTLVYDKCGFHFGELIVENESQEYGACTFTLNGLKIKFRISKHTPIKIGQFVAIWKRNNEGITQPFDLTDNIDFVIISSQNGNHVGQFIFPKSILLDKGIMTKSSKLGKRGIRVYPPWDTVSNIQAERTQLWQTNYFLAISNTGKVNLNLAKQLLSTSLQK